jgi:hypothetical protein
MRLYNTADASIRLRERHGVKHSAPYLRKLRCWGRGPAYVLFNGRPHYTDETLDAYVETSTSAPAKSGVEHKSLGHRAKPPGADAARTVP